MTPPINLFKNTELAQPTLDQIKMISNLRSEYGMEDKLLICLIEGTGAGIVRMDWCEQRRHLFIKPDGTRLTWDVVSAGNFNTGQLEGLDGR